MEQRKDEEKNVNTSYKRKEKKKINHSICLLGDNVMIPTESVPDQL